MVFPRPIRPALDAMKSEAGDQSNRRENRLDLKSRPFAGFHNQPAVTVADAQPQCQPNRDEGRREWLRIATTVIGTATTESANASATANTMGTGPIQA